MNASPPCFWCLRIDGRCRAFTLVELILVVIILGLLAAIVLPSFQRATSDAEEAALCSDLKVMRQALAKYFADHKGKYPPSLSGLVMYTDEAGTTSPSRTAVYRFGPYIRRIPPCPTGLNKGATGWGAANANPPTLVDGTAGVGWLYHVQTGGIWVNDIDHLDK